MKKFWSRFVLNIALCANVLIFVILSVIAFYSIGFADGTTLGKGAAGTSSSFFWLGLFGIIFVVIAILFPFIKLFQKKDNLKRIFDIVNFAVLTLAICFMLASQIMFLVSLEKGADYFKVIGSFALIIIGYSVTVQPQMKLIFLKTKTIEKESPSVNQQEKDK